MAIGLGEGAELRTPMAIIPNFRDGLLVGTILTLVVIPTVYDLVVRERQEVAG